MGVVEDLRTKLAAAQQDEVDQRNAAITEAEARLEAVRNPQRHYPNSGRLYGDEEQPSERVLDREGKVTTGATTGADGRLLDGYYLQRRIGEHWLFVDAHRAREVADEERHQREIFAAERSVAAAKGEPVPEREYQSGHSPEWEALISVDNAKREQGQQGTPALHRGSVERVTLDNGTWYEADAEGRVNYLGGGEDE